MPTPIVLGLDGGSTKTAAVALALDTPLPQAGDGASLPILGQGHSGASNWNSVGVETARRHFEEALTAAALSAGCTFADVAAVCVGMSGVDRPDDRARAQGWMDELFPGRVHVIDNDAVVALACGTGGERYGVVIISGTGMIAMGFNRAGQRVRAGGWGALLGDGGSGYAIGAAVLRAVTWAADGRGPTTLLLPRVLDTLNLAQPEALVRWAYDRVEWQRFAELAPLATACAAEGDAVAQAILAQAVDDLAVAVETVAGKLAFDAPFPLVTAGGVLHPGPIQTGLAARFATTLPLAEVRRPSLEPAEGAALLALRAYRAQQTGA